jgi:hypothetical protein
MDLCTQRREIWKLEDNQLFLHQGIIYSITGERLFNGDQRLAIQLAAVAERAIYRIVDEKRSFSSTLWVDALQA